MQVLNIVLAIAILYVILYYRSEGFASYAYAGSFDDDGVLGARDYSGRIGEPFLRESPETNPEIDRKSVV